MGLALCPDFRPLQGAQDGLAAVPEPKPAKSVALQSGASAEAVPMQVSSLACLFSLCICITNTVGVKLKHPWFHIRILL